MFEAVIFENNPASQTAFYKAGFVQNKKDVERWEKVASDSDILTQMKLIEPSMEYDRQIQAYRQDFLEYGGSMDGCGSLRRFDRTQDWLDQVESFKRAETTPPDFVPVSQYIYVRETDNKIVGVIQIRHYFNTFLEQYGGHIGYSVCPSERRKGYATQMLRLVLPKCKELGIDRVLISCVQGNEGSRKVILNNGGKYESTVYEPESDLRLERYWIDLSDDI